MAKLHMNGATGMTACGLPRWRIRNTAPAAEFAAQATSHGLRGDRCQRCVVVYEQTRPQVINSRLTTATALRRLAARTGSCGLEKLLSEVIEHQAREFEDDDDSLESIDGDALVTFIADWRKRLVDFVNTHNGVE